MDKLTMLARVLQQSEDDQIKKRAGYENHDESLKEIRSRCVSILTENEIEKAYNTNEEAKNRRNYWNKTTDNDTVRRANKFNGRACLKYERDLKWMKSREKTMKKRECQLGEMYDDKMIGCKRESRKKIYQQDQEVKEKYEEIVLYSNETEVKNDGNLCKDWEIAELPSGKYYLDFKSPYFTMNERIKIIEAALEDIRERYIDAKDEYNKFNRKCSKMKRKRRVTGSK